MAFSLLGRRFVVTRSITVKNKEDLETLYVLLNAIKSDRFGVTRGIGSHGTFYVDVYMDEEHGCESVCMILSAKKRGE